MTPLDIRIAILRSGTTQAAIARSAGCSRELVCRVIDNKVVSDRVRRAIAKAIDVPVEMIWRSYYLTNKPGQRGRKGSQYNRRIPA